MTSHSPKHDPALTNSKPAVLAIAKPVVLTTPSLSRCDQFQACRADHAKPVALTYRSHEP
jgi:hypothetical protein